MAAKKAKQTIEASNTVKALTTEEIIEKFHKPRGKKKPSQEDESVRKQDKRTQSHARYGGGRTKGKVKISYEDQLAILSKFEAGVFAEDIAKEYGIAKSYVYRIIDKPEFQNIREHNKAAKTRTMLEMLEENNDVIENITKRYLELAIDEERIAKTNLVGLFTVWGIIIDKQLKMQEMELKKEEFALRREELKQQKQNTSGLLSEFVKVISEKNTLEGDKENNENNYKHET